jgi:hypothetical protein
MILHRAPNARHTQDRRRRHSSGLPAVPTHGRRLDFAARQRERAVKRSLKRCLPTLEVPAILVKEIDMPKFVIERSIPNIGSVSAADLQAISQKSCGVLRDLGSDVQWVQSYVTGDKIYCIYNAASEALVREHARRGGFPADSVARVVTAIDPVTAEV